MKNHEIVKIVIRMIRNQKGCYILDLKTVAYGMALGHMSVLGDYIGCEVRTPRILFFQTRVA